MSPSYKNRVAANRATAHQPRIHMAGSGALLLNAACGDFDAEVQQRLWALAASLSGAQAPAGVLEAVPGVNNLLLVFDPMQLHPERARAHLLTLWDAADFQARGGRDIEVPVVYGGSAGEDLPWLASNAGVSIEEFVQLHSSAVYAVACIGSYPGFAYLSGLPAELAAPRRAVPRMKLEKGSVIIGGVQAGVMPCTAPSGWHVLGLTDLNMFDPQREIPCLLSPGDRVHFRVKGIEA